MHPYIRMAIHSINIILVLVASFSSIVLRFLLLPIVAINYLVSWLYNREAHKLDPIRRQFARREGWEGRNLGLNRDDWLLKTSIINIIFTIGVIIIYMRGA